MTNARAFSPSFHSAQTAATAALASPEGIHVYFRATALGGPDAARVASRRFQVNFCSLRTRARRNSERNLQQLTARDTDARGAYDKLVCNRTPLGDDGSWVVSLIPTSLDVSMLDMVDIATGQPVALAGKGQDEVVALVDKYMRSTYTHGDRGPPLTAEERARLLELAPDFFEQFTNEKPNPANPNRDPALASDEELGGF